MLRTSPQLSKGSSSSITMAGVHMSLLLGIILIQALQLAGDVSNSAAIDSEHTLLLIGGRKVNYPAMGEYGTNLVCRPLLPN